VRRSLPLIPYCRLVVGSRFVKLGWCLEYRRRKYVESYRTVKMRLAKLSSQAQKGGTVLDCVGEVSSCRRGTLACAAVDGIPKFSNARSAPRGEVRHKTISGLNVRQKRVKASITPGSRPQLRAAKDLNQFSSAARTTLLHATHHVNTTAHRPHGHLTPIGMLPPHPPPLACHGMT
jgi:hypothetical protein